MVLSPTLAVFEKRTGDRNVTEMEVRAFANMLKFIGLCHRAGAKIVVGSHTEVPHAQRGWAYQRELELLRECGLSELEAISAATLENARYFQVDDRLGSIEPGKAADLLLVAGNSLRDLSALRDVRGVMLNGNWVVGPGSNRFTDITDQSGVRSALEQHYQEFPKWWLSGLNLVDLDGDGKLDLFFAAHGAGVSLALLNDGKGNFHKAAGSLPPTEIHLPYDINEDGKIDLQMTWQDGGGRWWINQSSPGQLAFRMSDLIAGQARANAMIDINRDGNVDWLHENPGIVFELGDGKGNFKRTGNLEVARTRNEINMHPADLNGDGLIDLVLHWGRYDFEKGRSRVYLNSGTKTDSGLPAFKNVTSDAGVTEEGLAIKGIGDVNHDGSPDLLVLENKKPEIYLNDGHARFSKQTDAIRGMERASKPQYVSWGLAVVTDFDNDGRADIIWNGRNFLWVLRGTADGGFTYANNPWGIEDKSAASVDDGLCFGDIDGDGRLDIIGYAGKLDGQRKVKVYHNELAPQNWLRTRPIGRSGNRAAAGAKIRITEPGAPTKLIWSEQIMILDSQSAHSYYAYAQTERHFGLGQHPAVDVSVEFYPSGKRIDKRAVPANSTLVVNE